MEDITLANNMRMIREGVDAYIKDNYFKIAGDDPTGTMNRTVGTIDYNTKCPIATNPCSVDIALDETGLDGIS